MRKRIISVITIVAFAFMMGGCSGDTDPVDSKAVSSQVSSEEEVSSSTQSRVEIADKLTPEQKQTVIDMLADAEELTTTESGTFSEPIKLSEEQKLVPVILAQTDNIKFAMVVNDRIGNNNDATAVYFYTDTENLILPTKAVDVEGYKVYVVTIMYNVDIREICEEAIVNGKDVIITEDRQCFMHNLYKDSDANVYFKIDETTCCCMRLHIEDDVPSAEEFAQRIREDFVCKPLSEL